VAWLELYLRRPERAADSGAQALSLSEEYGFPQVAAFSRVILGRAQGSLTHSADAVTLVNRGLSDLAKTETYNIMTQLLTWLAETQSLNVAASEALTTIENALSANPEELSWRPDALRVRGELRLKLGQIELAEAGFREALAFAQKIGAKVSARPSIHLPSASTRTGC
jgi:hypothetical protein